MVQDTTTNAPRMRACEFLHEAHCLAYPFHPVRRKVRALPIRIDRSPRLSAAGRTPATARAAATSVWVTANGVINQCRDAMIWGDFARYDHVSSPTFGSTSTRRPPSDVRAAPVHSYTWSRVDTGRTGPPCSAHGTGPGHIHHRRRFDCVRRCTRQCCYPVAAGGVRKTRFGHDRPQGHHVPEWLHPDISCRNPRTTWDSRNQR